MPTENEVELDIETEWLRCSVSPLYFIQNYVYIENATETAWIKFKLWPEQVRVLLMMIEELLTIIVKARQLGLTWLVLALSLWHMIFISNSSIGLFSRGDRESMELLDRLKGMYKRLPDWLKIPEEPNSKKLPDSGHLWVLPNGSKARSLPTSAGESFTFSLVVFDEYARTEKSNDKAFGNVKPTIDAGGKMIILSIVNKDDPNNNFNGLLQGAIKKLTKWAWTFLPWSARPDRDKQWYKDRVNEALALYNGDELAASDYMAQNYPTTLDEALAPRQQNKRIPWSILKRVYEEEEPIPYDELGMDTPVIPGLKIYRHCEYRREYVIGADPAEGISGGDDSSLDVIDKLTGEQVAHLHGKFEPMVVFPGYIFSIARYYNDANILVERNNHGHAVIGALTDTIKATKLCTIKLLPDYFQKNKVGWLTDAKGKAQLYNEASSMIGNERCIIHDGDTKEQLLDIGIDKLQASEGNHDDCATSFCLACCATVDQPATTEFFFL